MSLKDAIALDNQRIFMNISEFAEQLSVQIGTTTLSIVGSMQSNAVENNSGNTAPLQSMSWTLYTPYPLAEQLRVVTGARMSVNGTVYTVDGISDEMGLCTIQLRTAMGR